MEGGHKVRSRNIKPGFFKNDILTECDPLARILFTGLWCMADREGRMEYRPKKIKAEILPYDDCDIIALLNQLIFHKFVVVYKFNDNAYLAIPTFAQHQNCHIKEAASTIPAPDENDTCTVVAHLIPDSLLLNTDSLLLNPSSKHSPDSSNTLKKKTRAKAGPECVSGFDKFWTLYPKKKAKGDAEKAWAKIKPGEPMIERILSAVQQAATSVDWTKEGGRFIPYPATWLNRKGWEDEVSPIGVTNPVVSASSEGIMSWATRERMRLAASGGSPVPDMAVEVRS